MASSPEITDCLESSSESYLTGLVRLAKIARVASAFGSFMYDILELRLEVAFAIGAFAVGVVSRAVADTSIEHGRATQVIVSYLQECMSSSGHFTEYVADSSVWILQRVCPVGEPNAGYHREPMGIG